MEYIFKYANRDIEGGGDPFIMVVCAKFGDESPPLRGRQSLYKLKALSFYFYVSLKPKKTLAY